MPLLGVDVIKLCAGEDLVIRAEAPGHQDPGAGLKLHPHAGVVTARGQQA